MKSVVLTTHESLYEHYKPTPLTCDKKQLPVNFDKYFRSSTAACGSTMSKPGILTEARKMFDNLHISDAEAKYLEQVTRNQTDSIVWHEQRIGKITASRIYDVMRTDENKPAKSTLKEICFTDYNAGLMNVPSIKYGREHESDAATDLSFLLEGGITKYDLELIREQEDGENTCNDTVIYTCHLQSSSDEDGAHASFSKLFMFSNALKLEHTNMVISKCGLHVSTENPFIAASPDRLVSCDCCENGVVEIKCPSSHEKTLDAETIIAQYFNQDLTLKKTHTYYYQVQTQMSVCDTEYAYFVLWTPNITIISFETRDSEWLSSKIEKLRDFFTNHIVPILMTSDLEWCQSEVKRQRKPLTAKENVMTYCLCNGIEDERVMVRCSNFKSCVKVWFHLECLKLTQAPKGRWLCPYCKK